jgi:hypothetical protein
VCLLFFPSFISHLVLLDHGLIVEIPDELRQQYWGSFILNKKATARAIGTQIAGLDPSTSQSLFLLFSSQL